MKIMHNNDDVYKETSIVLQSLIFIHFMMSLLVRKHGPF